MEIRVAKSAGFCFGVKRAIDIALDTATHSSGRTVQMLGDIVHNERVVEQIDEAGVKVIDNIEHADRNGVLLVRAHGTGPDTYADARKRGLDVVDATCPLVTDIHEKARELHEQGYPIIVIGDHGHDEVRGIAAQVPNAIVVATPDEVGKLGRRFRRVGVVCQSTQNVENVQAIIAALVPICIDLHFVNTICYPTTKHQAEIRTMPLENDVMIIVGSFTSANTKRMTEISRSLNPRTHQVTGPEDLDSSWFDGVTTVGVHAGASTPDFAIDEVVESIRSMVSEPTNVIG
ncbi:MAG TPA: 4-hydroxy-3-methylbut-2-enyl diphosphate reductase [Firmicutes bacterium]|nr:4-hydroxy-3-methylbut-2-enyl diphosphate reductase [Bacillota bacterium]